MAKFKKSFTSGGKQTSTANQVVNFYITKNGYDYDHEVEFLSFETFGQACRIKLNDEDTIHWIDADSKIVFTDINIEKFTIVDAGVEYYYTAFSVLD